MDTKSRLDVQTEDIQVKLEPKLLEPKLLEPKLKDGFNEMTEVCFSCPSALICLDEDYSDVHRCDRCKKLGMSHMQYSPKEHANVIIRVDANEDCPREQLVPSSGHWVCTNCVTLIPTKKRKHIAKKTK